MKTTTIDKPSFKTEITMDELLIILEGWIEGGKVLPRMAVFDKKLTNKVVVSDIRLRKCHNTFEIFWN